MDKPLLSGVGIEVEGGRVAGSGEGYVLLRIASGPLGAILNMTLAEARATATSMNDAVDVVERAMASKPEVS